MYQTNISHQLFNTTISTDRASLTPLHCSPSSQPCASRCGSQEHSTHPGGQGVPGNVFWSRASLEFERETRRGYLWKVCLLALCLLDTEDVRVLTFDVFHTSILEKRGETIDSTPNSSLLLKPPSCMLP